MSAETCTLRVTYKDGSECGQPAAYRVYGGTDCYRCCDLMELDECTGHPVCCDHAIELRTVNYKQRPGENGDALPPFVVSQIHSLAPAGAS